MAKILVTCSCCTEDSSLTPAQMDGRLCADNGDAEYRFTCQHCGAIVVKQTSDGMLETLEAAGVEIEVWSLPAECFETRSGPTLTHEDLLDFHDQLSDDAQVAEAIEQLI